MFLGHVAVALAAKRAAPRTSLGALLLASEWLDVLWPVGLLLGLERVAIRPGFTPVTPLEFLAYPWSHSLVMVLVWAAGFGWLVARRGGRRAGFVAGACVASHWFLDWLVHVPDLPLAPWTQGRYGLALWTSVPLTLALELGSLAFGLAVYLGVTRPRDATGRWALAGFVAFVLAAYAGAVFGPPPPSVPVLAGSALSGVLLTVWAAWLDRHRAPAG